MSRSVRVSRSFSAFSLIGITLLNSKSQSFLIASASYTLILTLASSTSTFSLIGSIAIFSFDIALTSYFVSAFITINFGFFASRSPYSSLTLSVVSSSFYTPFTYWSLRPSYLVR